MSANRALHSFLFDHLTHELNRPDQDWLGFGIGRHAVGSDIHLHGDAQKALQKRVVKFLCNTGAFGQTLVETGIDPRGDLAHAESVESERQKNAASNAEGQKPSCLEPGGSNFKLQRRASLVPNSVVITGSYVKRVVSRSKFRAVGLAPRAGVLPFPIDTIEFVTKQHALGYGDA